MSWKRKISIGFALTGIFLNFLAPAAAQDFGKWEKEISAFETADKAAAPKKRSIVFTGSSSIRLWEGLPEYFPEKQIINRGFGGSQTFEVTYFADRIVNPYKPKQVVIYSGDNDIAAGKTPETVLADFKALYSKIKAATPRTTVTFISIKPSPSRKQYMPQIVQTNALIKAFLEEQKRTSYVDVYTPMLLPGGKPKPELFRADSLHMTKAGYDIWARVLEPYLK
jgi:lysophospholipase L1-like esterase